MLSLVLGEVVNKLKTQRNLEQEASGYIEASQAVIGQIRDDCLKVIHLAALTSLRHGDAAAAETYAQADRIVEQVVEANRVMDKAEALYQTNRGSMTPETLEEMGIYLDEIQGIYRNAQPLFNRV